MPHLAPQESVVQLAHEMAAADETMQTILEETLESAEGAGGRPTESGRTACGDAANLRAPFSRYPESVDLQSCPAGLVGVWHTHVTQPQLLAPEHSLPDMANVAFGLVDVSIVAGAESAEVIVGADDREDMADSFRSTLGLDCEDTHAVVRAIKTGAIPNPSDARRRVRTGWEQLVYREPTGYQDIARRIERGDAIQPTPPPTAAAPVGCSVATEHGHGHDGDGDDQDAAADADADAAVDALAEAGAGAAADATDGGQGWQLQGPSRLRRQARMAPGIQELTGDLSIREEVAGSAIGIVAGRVVERALFG